MAYTATNTVLMVQQQHIWGSGSCLPQPLVKVSPEVFISLKTRIVTVVHGKTGRASQHIYFGILDDQIIIYTLSRTELAITIDIEAEKICKTLSL
ncbi:MAG: hypothetical protein ACFFCO_03835 [Promethearchaeota archaeon]